MKRPHKTRQSIIKLVILTTTLAIVMVHCSSCSPKYGCPSHTGVNYKSGYGIIKKKVSKDGISVVFKDNIGTWALDYLMPREYDSLQLSL